MKLCRFLSFLSLAAACGTAPAMATSFERASFAVRPTTSSVRVALSLPLRNQAELDRLIAAQSDRKSPEYRRFLTVAQFRASFAPSAATFERVIAALRAKGLRVEDVSTQSLHARGSLATMSAAFGTTISTRRFKADGHVRVVAMSPLHLDAALRSAGATVTGLDARPPRHTDSRRAAVPLNRYSSVGPYWFTDLREAYSYPSYATARGLGATIGIVISNDVLDSDTAAAFNHEKYTAVSGAPVPTVVRRPVDGGAPFDPNLSFESSLDVQESLGSAPGAHLVLYNLPDLSDVSVTDGYTAVVEDNVADVISSSFGLCELYYTAAYNGGQDYTSILKADRQLFKQGNAQGQTFVASSGDNAGLPCVSLDYLNGTAGTYVPGVEDPASDPNVTAVGGTNLVTTTPPSPAPAGKTSTTSRYVRESEFADPLVPSDPFGTGINITNGYFGSGSGSSAIWAKPLEQYLVNTGSKTRAVPDVSMQMGGCPADASSCGPDDSAYLVYDAGAIYGVVGTSASSPEFAGLLATQVGAYGQRLGNVNPLLYIDALANDILPLHLFHDTIPGYNGVVTVSSAPRAYNPIVGVGTPVSENYLGLPFAPRAGDPKTPTNP